MQSVDLSTDQQNLIGRLLSLTLRLIRIALFLCYIVLFPLFGIIAVALLLCAETFRGLIFAVCALTILGVLTGCASTPGSSTDSGPKQVNMHQLDQKRVMLFFDKETGAPFTGQMVERHPGGELRATLDSVDGIATGTATDWYESGQKKREM